MRRNSLIILSSFLFLLLSSLVAYLLRFADITDALTYLIAGAALLAVSFAVAYFGAEIIPINILSFIISACSLGALIRAWYLFRGFDNDLYVMLLVCAACALHLVAFCLVAELPYLRRHRVMTAVIYGVISLAAYLAVMLTTKTTYVSTFGYYMIVETAFLYAIIMKGEDRASLVRVITLSTFSVIGVAVILGVMMLFGDGADCDISGCDCGCDCNPGDNNKKKKQSEDHKSAT